MAEVPAYMRSQAADCLKRAQAMLAAGDEHSVRYACAELRFCIEYLLLDRLNKYREYLDDAAMAKWTPSTIVRELLKVDPHADQTATLSIGAESTPGVPATRMQLLGEDRRLKLKWANENWNALGNFLHAPSLQQIQDDKVASVETKQKKSQRDS